MALNAWNSSGLEQLALKGSMARVLPRPQIITGKGRLSAEGARCKAGSEPGLHQLGDLGRFPA